jgi:hypothetical protein
MAVNPIQTQYSDYYLYRKIPIKIVKAEQILPRESHSVKISYLYGL